MRWPNASGWPSRLRFWQSDRKEARNASRPLPMGFSSMIFAWSAIGTDVVDGRTLEETHKAPWLDAQVDQGIHGDGRNKLALTRDGVSLE